MQSKRKRPKRQRNSGKVRRVNRKTVAAKQRSNAVPKRTAAKVKYDDRYAGDYKYTCAITHAATGGLCSWCLCRPSKEIHHVRYRDSLGAIAGREVPGIDVFPVCCVCHRSACHSKLYWVHVPKQPELNNHNTPEFVQLLTQRFHLARLLKS